MPSSRNVLTTRRKSSRVCPLSRKPSTASSTDSTALITKRQPVSRSASKCSWYFRKFHGVADAVKEVWIAEGDVLRPGGHLAANVFEHHVLADNSEDSFVNRHDGAMAAEMLAAAARFR